MPTPMSSPSTPLRRRVPSKKYPIASPTPEASPLRPSSRANMQMNDDAAERAARRRSAHFADIASRSSAAADKENAQLSAHSTAHSSPADHPRKGSALAVQQGQVHKRAKRLSGISPAAAAAPPVSMEVMNTNFEEWMKLATDNKITATNTWNFALIDYFHDLTLLRNGPNDQSINFQKASCTLDGCVKIWTSRVDSVATETGKLLSGLAGGNGDGEREDGEEGDEDESGEPKTRKTHRSEATLAKSFGTLQIKKFDLEFTVDPLFKKTSADFDEGGAMGLLMNHLGIDKTGRVVFDAGDAVVEEDEEDDEETEDVIIDISRLRELIPSTEAISDMDICSTLAGFQFTSDASDMPDLAAITGLSSFADDNESREGSPPPMGTGEAVDFFGDEDYDMGGPMGGFDDGASMAGDEAQYGDAFAPAGAAGGALGMAGPGDGHGPFDPRRTGQELMLAFSTGDDGGMFDYFDRGFGKQWAGAEHWKLRKVSRKDPAIATAAREKRAAKAPFTIDFTSPEGAQDTKTLFAPGTKASTQLPSSSRARGSKRSAAAARRDEYLLPDDMHFSCRQLLRLFLKPKFALRMRRGAARMAEDANGEIDENFWAQAAADRAEGGDDMDVDGGAALPFESQFFHDEGDDGDADDDAFIDDALDAPMASLGDDDDDLRLGTQGQELRRARPENVNFAKKAKRVDVKRLKDDIWNDLKGLVADGASDFLSATRAEAASDAETDEPRTPTEPTAPDGVEPVKTFDTVIQSLRTSYPRDKMSEISTSFCFICLLHLANEEGLRIETARTDGLDAADVGMMGFAEVEDETPRPAAKRMDEGDRIDRVVGELQALRVFKDPNAGRAA